jgi:hypothetical protein
MAALSWNDLYAIWQSTTDPNYVGSLEQAGDGLGLEVFGQSFEQFARASLAVNRTLQSLFILPASGQEQDSAAQEARTTVTLTIARTAAFDEAVVLGAGLIWFEELAFEWGDEPGAQGVPVATGRRYTPTDDVTMAPGVASVSVPCWAELPGYSYNNPLVGSITRIVPVSNLEGTFGNVEVEGTNEWLTDLAGTASPNVIGCYLQFTGGANVNVKRRIIGYNGGRWLFASGTTLLTEESTASWRIMGWTEFGLTSTNALMPTGGRLGMLDAIGEERMTPRILNEPDATYRERVATMSDTVSPNAIRRTVNRAFLPFGLTGGALREAGMPLLPGMFFDVPGDDNPGSFDIDAQMLTSTPSGYIEGEKVEQMNADGAIATGRVAMLNGVFDSIVGCKGTFVVSLPIVGLTSGVSYVPAPGTITGGLSVANRYRYAFDFSEMRAFFMVGVPQVGLGDFGCSFDEGPTGALDLGFADGYPVGQAAANGAVWGAVNQARACGVAFDLYPA